MFGIHLAEHVDPDALPLTLDLVGLLVLFPPHQPVHGVGHTALQIIRLCQFTVQRRSSTRAQWSCHFPGMYVVILWMLYFHFQLYLTEIFFLHFLSTLFFNLGQNCAFTVWDPVEVMNILIVRLSVSSKLIVVIFPEKYLCWTEPEVDSLLPSLS